MKKAPIRLPMTPVASGGATGGWLHDPAAGAAHVGAGAVLWSSGAAHAAPGGGGGGGAGAAGGAGGAAPESPVPHREQNAVPSGTTARQLGQRMGDLPRDVSQPS